MNKLVKMSDFLTWLLSHLPLEQEEDLLIILKAHLLSEALINEFILYNIPNPQYLKSNRLNYPQRISIARSLVESKNDIDWIWNALKDLNSIRNDYAHKLEPDMNDSLEAFIQKITINSPGVLAKEIYSPVGATVLSLLAQLYSILYFNTYLSEDIDFKDYQI